LAVGLIDNTNKYMDDLVSKGKTYSEAYEEWSEANDSRDKY
jgi:hypothetical protein